MADRVNSPRVSTSPTCAGSRNAGCRAWSSTTSTAAPTPRSPCARTPAPSTTCSSGRAVRFGPRVRPAHDGARDDARAAVPARAGRQQPDVLPAGRGVAAGAAGERVPPTAFDPLGIRLEEVKAADDRAAPYQLYLVGGRDVAAAAMERAREAGLALVVTIDTPVAGLRERDLRNGTKELLTRKPWRCSRSCRSFSAAAMARGLPRRRRPDGVPQRRAARRPDAVRRRRRGARAVDGLLGRPAVDPGGLEGSDRGEGRDTGDDARRAVDAGADAVVVSNHGGRQLDGVSPTLRVLPEVVAAVNGQMRSAARRRRPPRQRRRQGALPRRARGAHRPRLCLRARRRRRRRRDAGDRHPPRRPRADAEAARVPVSLALDHSYVKVPADWRPAPRTGLRVIGSRLRL